MRTHAREFAREIPPTLAIAGPVVLGQIGLMLMSLVDTAMVGRLGANAIASVGVGHAIQAVFFMFGLGVLFGLDRVVSYAYGAGRHADCHRAFVQGAWVATALALPITLSLHLIAANLDGHFDAAIVPDAAAYLRALSWSMWPTLLFVALRQTLQAMGDVTVAAVVLLVSNVVNAGANALLIYGWWGAPELGVAGAGYATLASRVFALVALGAYAWWRGLGARGEEASWELEPARVGELLRLGLPAGVQLVFEGGVFAAVSLLAARLGPVAGAANQIVLQLASFTFMVPLGISAAGAVRVGQALGAGAPEAARRAGWAAVGLGVAFMVLSGVALFAASGPILAFFAPDPEVLRLARWLVLCAAVFQVFDGAQVTLSGALRGVADTLAPMLANLVGHWGVGLPAGAALCYGAGLGAIGLWMGLAIGLGSVALALLAVWHRRIGKTVAAGPA